MTMGSRWFSGLFMVVVVVVLGGLLYLGYFVSSLVQPASSDHSFVTLTINKGESVRQISQQLEQAGLLTSPWNFEVYLWLRRWRGDLQAGEYTLPHNITMRDLAQILAQGKSASNERSITFIEGWTLADMGQYLQSQGVVSVQDFQAAVAKAADRSTLTSLSDKPAGVSLEGYVFPDTYRIYFGSTADDIVQKALENFDTKLTPELRAEIKRRGLTTFQVITMASILEKEVKEPQDLALVADIFYRRLATGKPLQSDATLNYVLSNKTASLTAADLENPSPYNSYLHPGFPPGPIDNPGLDAIRAAVFPQANNYWYFLTTSDGHTVFAKTYQEHLANKKLYLEK